MSNTAQSPASRRIEGLLDGNSFVEIGGQVTARSTDFNLQQSKCPSDGVVTGYGLIDGNLVYVYSQDASVLNGTLGEMHAKKIVRLYEMACKMGAPGHRSDRLCGYPSAGGRRRPERIRRDLYPAGACVRSCSADYCSIRKLRRRTGYGTGTYRFYLYGREGRKAFCEFSQCHRRQ